MNHEKQQVSGDGGNITIENISHNPSTTLFKLTIENKPKSFLTRLKDLFTPMSSTSTIYVDRTNGKYISNYFHNHITSADKAYKSDKSETKITDSTDKPKKKYYKPRKPKTGEQTA